MKRTADKKRNTQRVDEEGDEHEGVQRVFLFYLCSLSLLLLLLLCRVLRTCIYVFSLLALACTNITLIVVNEFGIKLFLTHRHVTTFTIFGSSKTYLISFYVLQENYLVQLSFITT